QRGHGGPRVPFGTLRRHPYPRRRAARVPGRARHRRTAQGQAHTRPPGPHRVRAREALTPDSPCRGVPLSLTGSPGTGPILHIRHPRQGRPSLMPVPTATSIFVYNGDPDDVTQVAHLWDAYMDRYYQLRRAGLPLHISAFKGRIAGLVADDANEDAAIALLQLTRTELPTHEDHIIDTFTLGDCWALTLALCDTYQGMTPYVLESEDGEWVHTFAHDDRT